VGFPTGESIESVVSNAHHIFDRLSSGDKRKLLQAHNAIYCKAVNLVKKHSNWEKFTIDLWFDTRNPNLGNVSPLFMIAYGRGEKLVAWIESQIAGNLP
jgi:hypothetical protein